MAIFNTSLIYSRPVWVQRLGMAGNSQPWIPRQPLSVTEDSDRASDTPVVKF